jgi:hypothetical protein
VVDRRRADCSGARPSAADGAASHYRGARRAGGDRLRAGGPERLWRGRERADPRRRRQTLARAAERSRYAFDAARRGYAAGVTDLTTLLQSERTWLQNRATLNAAQYALLSDSVAAIRALGGGWDSQGDLDPRAPLPPVTPPVTEAH